MRRAPVILAYAFAALAPAVPAGLYYRAMIARGVAPGFPLDDSWIHAQYARTFVEGRPFEYVPGIKSMGTTALLFDLIWGGLTRLTGEYVYTIYWFNLLSTSLLAVILLAMLREFQVPLLLSSLGAAFIVCGYPFPWSVLSGMETALAAMVTAAAVLAHIVWGSKRGWRQLVGPVVMALAATARPENLVLYPLSELDRVLRYVFRRDEVKMDRPALRFAGRAAAFGLTILPYFGVNYAIHGSPVPNTYAAKVGDLDFFAELKHSGLTGLPDRLAVAAQVVYDAFGFVWYPNNAVLLGLAGLGILFCLLPFRAETDGEDEQSQWPYVLQAGLVTSLMACILYLARTETGDEWHFRLPIVLVFGVMATVFWFMPWPERALARGSLLPLLVFVGCTAASGLATKGIYFPGQSQRYLIQWIPLILVYGVLGAHLLARAAAAMFPSRAHGAYLTTVCLVLVMNLALFVHPRLDRSVFRNPIAALRHWMANPEWTGQFLTNQDFFVLAVKNINEMQVWLGHWVDQHTPKDAVIATNDIGAIAFFGNRPIVDTIGLIDPEIVQISRQTHHTDKMLSYLQQRRVTHAILFPRWHPDLLLDPRFTFIEHVALSDSFVCGDETMVVAEVNWENPRKLAERPAWVAKEMTNCRFWLDNFRRLGKM